MKQNNKKNVPLGVLFIVAFNIFGALMLIISIFTNPTGVSEVVALAHGFSPILGIEILVAVSALAFLLAYGLFSLSRWGFYLSIAYSLYLVVASLCMGALNFLWTGQAEFQNYFGNLLGSLLVVIYLILVRSRFFKPQPSESQSL